MTKEQTRGRKWGTSTEQQERDKAKDALRNCIRHGFDSIPHRCIEDDRYRESWLVVGQWFQWRHLPSQQGGKRPEFRAAIQERQRITTGDSLVLPDFPKPNWQQQQQSQQQRGSRIRSQETSDSSRAGGDPMRKGTRGGATTSGIIGQRGTKTSFNLCLNNEGSATKDGNFSVTDRECKQYIVHNGTFPALAHSNTRGYALTLFLVWLKPSRFIFAPWKEHHLKSQRLASIAGMHTFMHYTDATLDIETDEQANVSDCKRPWVPTRLRSVFDCFSEQASPTSCSTKSVWGSLRLQASTFRTKWSADW